MDDESNLGLEGYDFEDDPDRVQEAQPHSNVPLRSNPFTDGVDFPSPHVQIDAHIGDSKGKSGAEAGAGSRFSGAGQRNSNSDCLSYPTPEN